MDETCSIVVCVEELGYTHKVLISKLERKRTFRRRRRRWENIIKICLKGIESADVHEIHLTQVRSQWLVLVNTVMKIRVL
jgi:hypothetical protein